MQDPEQRRVILKAQNDLSLIPNSFEPDYIPKVGLTPFEVSSTHIHPGTAIFNLIDTADMGKEDLLKKLAALDPRILEDMPEEVLKQIEDGNVSHIFQTDPSTSQKYMDMTPSEQKALEGKGSIYLRTKEGKTARFKLPEVADADAGWNANKGASIFMDQTVYSTPENVRSLLRQKEVTKKVKQGTVAAETIDERILNSNIVDDILSGSQTLTGATAPVAGENIPSAPKVTTGPTPGAVPSGPTVTTGETPGAGRPRATVTTGPTPGAVPPTPTVTTGPTPPKKPIGRPVIPVNTTAPTATAAGAQQTAQATTQSGNATPPPKATIHSNAPTPPRPSSGAPAKAPGKMRALADDVSAAVTKGPNGGRNLKMLGIAGALGVAGFGLSRGTRSVQDENKTNQRLEMQRRGII
jgi:hypothetical protein